MNIKVNPEMNNLQRDFMGTHFTPIKSAGGQRQICLRLYPKMHYGIMLMGRMQKRSMTSFLQVQLQRLLDDPHNGLIEEDHTNGKILNLLDILWEKNEFDRLVRLSIIKPQWMTEQEESLINFIKARYPSNQEFVKDLSNIRKYYTMIKQEHAITLLEKKDG